MTDLTSTVVDILSSTMLAMQDAAGSAAPGPWPEPAAAATTAAPAGQVRELGGDFWMPPAASTLAPATDFAFQAITWLSLRLLLRDHLRPSSTSP